MTKLVVSTLALAAVLAAAAGYVALVPPHPADTAAGGSAAARPLWTEVQWPFPMDQWGTGRAFACKAADCGSAVALYLRSKLGACNCATGVETDADLDRMSDFDLIGGEVSPLAIGRPITIGWMKGRSRAYTPTGGNRDKSILSVVFNDRCDMIVATVVLPAGRPAAIEPGVIDFLSSQPMLHWAELELGI
ncbi:MAG TPA: hypothetical protein VH934_02085 [Xanthobacteraceae bacterium]